MGEPSYQVPSINGPPKVCHYSEADMALHVHAWWKSQCDSGVKRLRDICDRLGMRVRCRVMQVATCACG
jgi:hypothetical protein